MIATAGGLAVPDAWRLPSFDSAVQLTNNAYGRCQTTVIALQVSGYVVKVAVADFADISGGQTLVCFDDRIYRQREARRATALSAPREVDDDLARRLRDVTNRYLGSYWYYLEQLGAQRRLLGAQLALIQSRAVRPSARVALCQAMGDGWHRAHHRSDRRPTLIDRSAAP